MSYCKSVKQVAEKALSFEQKSGIHLPSFSTGPVQMKSTMARSVDEIKINLHTANLQDSSAAVLAGWLFLTLPPSHPRPYHLLV